VRLIASKLNSPLPASILVGIDAVPLKSLLDQEDFVQASFLLSVLGEGTFIDLLRHASNFTQRTGPFMVFGVLDR